jgi:beta-glucosidase
MSRERALPADFRFGVATAAYQIEGAAAEGGRRPSIWDVFCRVPGAVAGGDNGDVACDHFHRWREDLDLMRDLGMEAYRFSIAWPRVVPDRSGKVNAEGLAFYRRLCEGLVARGIEPIATLYHWDLPQSLQETGGWAARDTAARFADYAHVVASALGDVVTQWVTHNEPWCAGFLGHQAGRKAPGLRDWPTAIAASHHLLLSHGLATRAIRAAAPAAARVGIALNVAPVRPASAADADVAAARRQDGYLNRWFLDPVLLGRYPDDMLSLYGRCCGPLDAIAEGDLAVVAEPIDFLGVNYYNPMRVRAAPGDLPLELVHVEPHGETTAMGWEVDPDGLHEVLMRLRRRYPPVPVYITENGASFDDPPATASPVPDPRRRRYLERHLAALRRAIADGADVRRYCVWSLLDNFEWEDGYDKRFGIVYVDYATQRRIPKESALWYRDYIAAARSDGAGPG